MAKATKTAAVQRSCDRDVISTVHQIATSSSASGARAARWACRPIEVE